MRSATADVMVTLQAHKELTLEAWLEYIAEDELVEVTPLNVRMRKQDLVKFKMEGNDIEVIDVRKEQPPFVVMGVRACDYKAFDVLDRVYLQAPMDTFYQNKRNAGI